MNNTVQRKVILEEMRNVKFHPTADEVYDLARKRIPNISLATVYRNLEKMAKNGDLIKLDIAGRRKRYDADLSGHYHFRCRSCGGVSDLNLSIFSKVLSGLDGLKGKEGIEDYSLEFSGVCSKCKEGAV